MPPRLDALDRAWAERDLDALMTLMVDDANYATSTGACSAVGRAGLVAAVMAPERACPVTLAQ